MLFFGLVFVGSNWKYVDPTFVPPQLFCSPGRSQPGKLLPGAFTFRPLIMGSCKGSFTNSASCWVSGSTSASSTTEGAAARKEASTNEFPLAESTPCAPHEQQTVASPVT